MKKHFLLLAMALMTSVVSFAQTTPPTNLAKTCTVKAKTTNKGGNKAENAVDGDYGTKWASDYGEGYGQDETQPTDDERNAQWFYVDLGSETEFNTFKMFVDNQPANNFEIRVSNDIDEDPTDNGDAVLTGQSSKDGENIYHLEKSAKGRYVIINFKNRATTWGYGIYEFEVYNIQNQTLASLASNISFIHAGNADSDALDIEITAMDELNVPIKGLKYTLSNNAQIVNGKLKAPNAGLITISATSNGVTKSCYVYAVDGSGTPTHNDVSQMIYHAEGVNPSWQTGWSLGSSKQGNELSLGENAKGQVFRNVNAFYFGLNNSIMNLSTAGWKDLSMDVCVADGCDVTLVINEEKNDDRYKKTATLKQGWNTITFSLENIPSIRTMALTADGKANVLVTNIYFSKADANSNVSAEVKEIGYATFSSHAPVIFGEGVTVYTAKVSEGNTTVTLTEVEGKKVPAEAGVIIKAANGTYTATVLNEEVKFEEGINDLKVSTGVTATDDTNFYVLSKEDDAVGFYKLSNGVQIPGGKAYLEINNAPKGAMKMVIGGGSGDGSTGISNINAAENLNGAAYNLNGIRVNDSYKGIVIINGKKVIRK